MTFIVPRTCTEPTDRRESRPLADLCKEPAYVLLGDPGSGKTTAFLTERARLGDAAFQVTARDFITFKPKNRPEWWGKTLFIDGLDEVRAGRANARAPFDYIRGRLEELGRPSFRLSCRSADWLGPNDQSNLESVSPNGKVTVLNLDPLTRTDILLILDDNPDIDNPKAFLAEARERGLDGLLTNPQSLELLVNLVAGERSWPEGRRETFQGACTQMADEHNDEHRIAEQVGTIEERLDAAGRLCAIQLIADIAGYTTRQHQGDEEFMDPDRCCYEDRKFLRAALSTKLFTIDVMGVARPVHRHIAEFIGALHLAKVIKDGLPAKRVIALITGEDGLVVTELRGLSAWLAAVSKASRSTLIDLDPIGVGLYGDIRNFSPEDKLALLSSLSIQGLRLDLSSAVPAFASLAAPETSSAIRETLTESDRSSERQSFVVFLLLVLAYGHPMEELSAILLDVVNDDSWQTEVRQSALVAFVNCRQDSRDRARKLIGLLASIRDGKLEDSNDELLGTLLAQLYPQDLPPSEVWDYLHISGDQRVVGSYRVFWRTLLIDQSSDDQVAELLTHLKGRIRELRPALKRHGLNELPLELLERVLYSSADAMEVEDLYDWLSVGLELEQVRRKDAAHARIRDWLEEHPDTQKAVIAEGLSRSDQTNRFRFNAFKVYRCLYGAALPSDYGLWSLKQAVAMADTKPLAAEHLLERAFLAFRDQKLHEGVSIELLRSLTVDNDGLKSKLEALLSPPDLPPNHECDREDRAFLEDQRRKEREWLDYVRSQREELRENRAAPQLLYEMAECYLGGINSVVGGPGVEAIEELLKGDQDLVSAVIQGFRSAIDRSDIPDVAEVVRARSKDQMFLISLPILVGMAEFERTSPETLHQLSDGQVRRALAFYHDTPHGGDSPGWYRTLLLDHPKIVADVKHKFIESGLRGDKDYISGLWDLAHDQEHAEVARLVSTPLLRVFPTRCSTKQTELLDVLLQAAIQHADTEKLIDEKLSIKRMNVAQKSRWLAAGLTTSPEKYLALAEGFAENSRYSIRHLAALFHTRLPIPIDVRVASLLIRLVGSSSDPGDLYSQGWVTPAEEASRLVRDLIARLSSSPDRDASLVLDALVNDPILQGWSGILLMARDGQRVIRRDSSFRHPTVEQVCDTLSGSTPANAADLAGLLVDRLEELALRIHTANTDDWRQYWDGGSHGQSPKPKHEEHCRDALLSDLRQMLPEDVNAQPEGQYKGDRRSDIRVDYNAAFHVPIEIKKNTHSDLWSAMHDQLIRYYCSDPDTDGFGIYLVFWFGSLLTQKSPDGVIPDGPDELREQLLATLSAEDVRKIAVSVVDVSPAKGSD